MTIGDIAHHEQFLLLPQCFNFYSIIKLFEIFQIFAIIFKVICCRVAVCAGGFNSAELQVQISRKNSRSVFSDQISVLTQVTTSLHIYIVPLFSQIHTQ